MQSMQHTRQDILETLRRNFADLAQRFDVQSLAVFGSASRDQLRPESDVDILVRFKAPATLRGYAELKDHLESLLGRSVDLATEPMLKSALRERILNEAIHVA